MIRALVLWGSRNIFTLRTTEGEELECRIKGKVLKGVEGFYNPLAPGDRVLVEKDPGAAAGLITAVEERRNRFTRVNQKGQDGMGGRGGQDRGGASQLLAANVDTVLCVTTPASPPWRPRFLDRLILQADIAGIEPVILCNKWELAAAEDPDIDERLEDYRRIGYEVARISVRRGWGMDALRERLRGTLSVLIGQSGVGKSSIINALLGQERLRVGALNEKYDRGNHTTSMSALLEFADGGGLIDTPGIRRLLPDGVTKADLVLYLREFAPLAGSCSFGLSCSHRTEPGCKILEAVDAGVIHEDRYENFLRLRDELPG